MPLFLGVHNTGQPMPEDQFKGVWAKYQEACKSRGADAKRVYLNFEEGRGYCITEANSAKDVQDAHNESGVPADEVIEVQKIK